MSAQVVSAAMDTNRNCTVEITNSSSYSLVNPQVYLFSGNSLSPPKPKVQPNETMVCTFTKWHNTARGAVGVLTYDINGTEFNNERLALMFSVPFDHNIYDNWLAVGIFYITQDCDNKLYHSMYYDQDGKFFRRFKGNSSCIEWIGHTVKICANMSSSGKAIIHLEVHDVPFV